MRKLLWFTIGFCVACLLAVYLLPEEWLPWAAGVGAALLAALAIVGLRLRRNGSRSLRGNATTAEHGLPVRGGGRLAARRVGCAALGLAVGLLWCWGYAAVKHAPARALEGKHDELCAEACTYAEQTRYGQRVDAYVDAGRGRVRVRFYLYGQPVTLRPGDRFTGSFSLRRTDGSDGAERRLELSAAGISLTGSGKVRAVEDGGAPFRYFPARWSRAVFDRLGELIPADAAGLPQAMLTGKRDGVSARDRDALSGAGTAHVMAVSGLHVALLTGLVFLLLGRNRLASWLALCLLLLFVCMTGASPSVLRAALLLGLMGLAPLVREERDPPSSLAFAGLLILCANPWVVANLSFQLSFGAVAGLLLLTPPLRRWLLARTPVRRLLRWDGLRRFPAWLRNPPIRLLRWLVRTACLSVSATCGALVFTLPLSAAVFGAVPVYSAAANLLVLPLVTVCLGGALAVLGLGLLHTGLGCAAGALLACPLRLVFWLSRFFAGLPGARLWTDSYGVGFLVFLYLCLGLAILRREQRFGRPLAAILAALVAALGLQALNTASAVFSFAVLNVGQGQCVCAVTDDFTAVIDCGGSGSAAGTAQSWLLSHGAERIDALILTHYDSDHVNGVAELLDRVPTAAVYLPDVPFDPGNRAAVERAALDTGAALVFVREDLVLPFSDGQFRLFAPVSDRSDNAACISVLYSVEEYDMLLTGDMDAEAEYALLEREALPTVELYVAGHHGSARSSSAALLEALRPQAVAISVGRNAYGLPSDKALARFAAIGARVYRTDECGNLEIGR